MYFYLISVFLHTVLYFITNFTLPRLFWNPLFRTFLHFPWVFEIAELNCILYIFFLVGKFILKKIVPEGLSTLAQGCKPHAVGLEQYSRQKAQFSLIQTNLKTSKFFMFIFYCSKLILIKWVCLHVCHFVIESAYMIPTNDLSTDIYNEQVAQILDTEMY